jgi:hypothetical protein
VAGASPIQPVPADGNARVPNRGDPVKAAAGGILGP